jgi:diguanylate cyclase (GGDEF)-like protein
VALSANDSEEDARLKALDRYDIIDTPPEEAFDRIVRIAQKMFRVPMSSISFLDGHRQWLKARQGIGFAESKRCDAICNIAIAQNEPLVIEDTTLDERVRDNSFVTKDPHLRFYAGAQLRTRDGHNLGALCIMDDKPHKFGAEQASILADLADMVVNELDLRVSAGTDYLTGALSRRAFKEEAERAKLLAVRHGHPLSCMIFDLDHFKAVNDVHGHAVGDLVLKRSVIACVAKLRKSDLIGRIGGEEFAVLFPHTTAAAAVKVAEKVRRAIAGVAVPGETGPLRVSASFGVAELDRAVPDLDGLLKRADDALYAAKQGGRNQCSEWRPTGATQANLMRKVFKAGQIAFNAGNSVIDCTVRGLSDNGAQLNVVSTADIPEKFKLKVNADNISRFCRVVTKREKQVDVAFD